MPPEEGPWIILAIPTVAIRVIALAALALFVHLPLANENRMHMAWYNLGNKYRELERWDEAVEAYRTSLESNEGAISTHNNMAVALERGGRIEEAIHAWRVVGALGRRIGSARHVERAERHLRTLEAKSAVVGDEDDPADATPDAP